MVDALRNLEAWADKGAQTTTDPKGGQCAYASEADVLTV